MVNCLAIGDTIASMPIIKALIKEGRLNKILALKSWIELFKIWDIPLDICTWMNKDEQVFFDPGEYLIAPFYLEHRAPYRIHLTDFFSFTCCYAVLKPEEKNLSIGKEKFIRNPVDSTNYVVLQAGTREYSRTLLPGEWNEIKDHLIGRGFDVVLLGDHFQNQEYDTSGCIEEYLGCSLTQSLAIINGCNAVIAIDGGLVYIAAMTEAKIIVGYTFVDPHYRLPYRHDQLGWNCRVIEPDGNCRYCTNTLAGYGIMFDKACPANLDFECVRTLRASGFKREIDALHLKGDER